MTDHDTPVSPAPRPRRRPGWRFWTVGGCAALAALVAGWLALGITATVTVRSLFFTSLGMGDAYATRWHATMWLSIVGLVLAVVLSLPLLALRRVAVSPPQPVEESGDELTRQLRRLREREFGHLQRSPHRSFSRLGLLIGFGFTLATLAVTLPLGLASTRDKLLAAGNTVPFGSVDPVFGRDLSFFVFQVPAWQSLVNWLLLGAALALAAFAVAAACALFTADDRRDSAAVAALQARTATLGFLLGGLLTALLGADLWLSRYGMVSGGDEVIAGAGKAAVGVDLPIRTIGAIVTMLLAAALLALALPALRRRLESLPVSTLIYAAGALWAAMTVVMVVTASLWCLLLLIPVAILIQLTRMQSRGEASRLGGRTAPVWATPALAVMTILAAATFGPIGAALNDAIVLRGTKLQVERPFIERTLEATRAASGLDGAQVVDATYRQNGVTREAIAAAPASVSSLRFLDYPPTQQACARLQTFNQFYTCADIDLDRYEIDGVKRSVFVAGREIDYDKLGDFQRRHFTFTHGFGLVMAPVNEIDPAGRPRWIAGGIPQTGIEIDRPEIYFGAQEGMPWAAVNTTQPQFDALTTRQVAWKGTTGVRIGSGWRRLALTKALGGLPYVGGGRQFWNATKGAPAGPDSQVLLHRDIRTRVGELAPFLRRDADPYFAVADGRLFVVLNTYVATDDYPYSASYDGARYLRQAAIAVMDAYSGETKMYVTDESEPMLATWARVYPSLFTPMSRMPEALRPHLRVGEDQVNYQSRVAERFHVTDVDRFYNNDEGWAPTQEAYGPGVNGGQITSPVRYTFAVLPGETQERFLAVRTYKPRTQGRGIGFSGWLAADNSPGSFGKLTLIRFATNSQSPLDSLDTFTANVARNEGLSAQLGVRRDQVLRGNTIVVPVGDGLLYTQPLYLDTPGSSSLPTLWQVVVSFGDGRVFAAPTFAEALEAALTGSPGAEPGDGTPASATIQELVRRAAAEYEAYRKAFGAGDDAAAARHLAAFQEALAQADRVAEAGAAPGAP